MKRTQPTHAQAGQVSAEYLVGCLIVVVLLLADAGHGESMLATIGHAVREGFARFATALSLT